MIVQSKTLDWQSFDDFKVINFQLFTVITQPPTADETFESFCDCKAFFKEYKCVHSLGMDVRLGYVQICDKDKASAIAKMKSLVPIGKKNKRGRPKVAGKPLLID